LSGNATDQTGYGNNNTIQGGYTFDSGEGESNKAWGSGR